MRTAGGDESIFTRTDGRWHEILERFGIDRSFLRNRHGPCPVCDEGTDRFRFDNKEGRGTFYCSVCGAGDGWKLLQLYTGWDSKRCAEEVEAVEGSLKQKRRYAMADKPDFKKREDRLRKVYQESVPVTQGDPVTKYLVNRGLTFIPTMLRFHPKMEYFQDGEKIGEFPAMLARVTDQNSKPATYHVTYLTDDGQKAQVDSVRKILPPIMESINGCSVKLFSPAGHIGIAEGIETAIAAHEMSGLPVWSTLNATLMGSILFPPDVKRVTIFADRDTKFGGQYAAFALAHKLATGKDRIRVTVKMPSANGADFLDFLNSSSAVMNHLVGAKKDIGRFIDKMKEAGFSFDPSTPVVFDGEADQVFEADKTLGGMVGIAEMLAVEVHDSAPPPEDKEPEEPVQPEKPKAKPKAARKKK